MATQSTSVMSKVLIDGKNLPVAKAATFTPKQIETKQITDMLGNQAQILGPQIPNDISFEAISGSNNILILDKAIAKLLKGEVLEMVIICQNGNSFRFNLNDIKYSIKDDGMLDIKTLSLCTRHEIV